MIASRLGLVVLGAIAVALGVVLALDLVRTPPSVGRALAPDFDPRAVGELRWTRTDQPEVDLVRMPGGWLWHGPARGVAEPAAVAGVLDALRAGRWHRDADPDQASPIRTRLAVSIAGVPYELAIGRELAGTDQIWVVARGRALLVDGWVARALDVAPVALRVAHPFDDVAAASRLELRDDRLQQRFVFAHRQLLEPRVLQLAPEIVDAIHRALAAIAVTGLPTIEARYEHDLVIALEGARFAEIRIGGACPGAPARVTVFTPAGDGCIEAVALLSLRIALGRLRDPPEAIVDRRPAAVAVKQVDFGDGSTLELASHPGLVQAGARADLDPARVDELLAALATPADVTYAPSAKTKPKHTLALAHDAGSPILLDVYDRVVVRRGEPIALRPTPQAFALLDRPALVYRDPTRWVEEPTTISSIAIDAITFTRGATIGEWTRTPLATVDAAKVDALAAAVAAVRAPATPLAASFTPVHKVAITITPPVGAPSTHHLDVGRQGADGCPARADDQPALLPATTCAAIYAVVPR